MKNKRFTAVATAAAIMLGVCGCAGNTASSTVGGSTDVSSASGEAKNLEEVSVVLDWHRILISNVPKKPKYVHKEEFPPSREALISDVQNWHSNEH